MFSKKSTTMLSAFAIASLSTLSAQSEPSSLYETSFEKQKPGIFSSFKDGATTWKSLGKAKIDHKHRKTGKQSLHIFGGENNTVEINLEGELQNIRGISFSAERWTGKKPFKFRIEAMINGNWKQISNLDLLINKGHFSSDIVVAVPHEIIGALRFKCTAPEKAGILIDDLKFLKGKPENISKMPEVATEKIRKLLEFKDIFVSGTENTHTFRIPAIVTAPNGDLIACVDARRKNAADLIWVKDIDIVIKRSTDNGKTWGPMETVIDYGDESTGKPASDPSFIVDKVTGEIFCFYNFMDQINAKKEFRLHVQSSKDNGKTWSKPRDITDSIAKPEWKMDFKFITSGRGIQTEDGELLHTLVNLRSGLHIYGSKDHGKTWYFKDVAIKPANESKIIQLTNGDLMINSRLNGKGFRGVHLSKDNGQSWSFSIDKQQVDPGCNGSILRYTSKKDGYSKDRLLLANANSYRGRKNLTVKISYDEGATWSKGKVIDAGPSAYSDLTICKDGSIAVLYEPGYKAIRFASFTLEDLTDGKDKLEIPYKH